MSRGLCVSVRRAREWQVGLLYFRRVWDKAKYEDALTTLRWAEMGEWERWMQYALAGGGKRFRPQLAWFSYAFYAGAHASWEVALPLLRGIELLHTFTLVHDDVMDRSDLRRGRPTIYRLTDADTAILIGDALLIGVYQEVMHLPAHACKAIGDILSHAALRVCHGQLLDLDMTKRPTAEVGVELYLQMITEKTGALIGAALEAGAALAGADENETRALRIVGEAIGRYFQLQDDYLDAFGEETGKVRGGDIAEGKKTFLWLWAWQEASPEEQVQMERLSGEARRAFGLELYERLGLRAAGEAYMQRAYDELMALLPTVACHSMLMGMVHQLAGRVR